MIQKFAVTCQSAFEELPLTGVKFCFARPVYWMGGRTWWIESEVSSSKLGYQSLRALLEESSCSSDGSGEKNTVDHRVRPYFGTKFVGFTGNVASHGCGVFAVGCVWVDVVTQRGH